MKLITFIALTIVIMLSIVLNIHQNTQIKHYERLFDNTQMKYCNEWEIIYPVDGLSIGDISIISATIDRHELNPQNRRIIEIKMRDRNHVQVRTGIVKSGLCGTGKLFIFRRGLVGWEIDNKSMITQWCL